MSFSTNIIFSTSVLKINKTHMETHNDHQARMDELCRKFQANDASWAYAPYALLIDLCNLHAMRLGEALRGRTGRRRADDVPRRADVSVLRARRGRVCFAKAKEGGQCRSRHVAYSRMSRRAGWRARPGAAICAPRISHSLTFANRRGVDLPSREVFCL